MLEHAGYEVRTALDRARAGEELFRSWRPDAVVTDMMLPDVDGLDLVQRFKQANAESEIIVVTGHGSIPKAVDAIKAGASYFLEKPVDAGRHPRPARARRSSGSTCRSRTTSSSRSCRTATSSRTSSASSKKMQELFELVESVAASEANILIQGENGTGKELIANAIHYNSKRAKGPFIKINCAAIPKDLIESELFGYQKGAFTGATTDKDGLFEMAEGGSLLLDEIGEMPPYLQTKLLRVLQEREYRPIGSDRIVHVDFRLICATNIDLDAALRDGQAARGSVLPHQHDHAARAAAARAHRGHPAAVRALPREVPPALREAGPRRSRRRRITCSSATGGRATCASWRTPSSGPCWWPRGPRFSRRDLPESLREETASPAEFVFPPHWTLAGDREDGDPADAAADELEQAGSRRDPRAVPARRSTAR